MGGRLGKKTHRLIQILRDLDKLYHSVPPPDFSHEFVMLSFMQVITCLGMNVARIPYMQFAMACVDGRERHLQETKMDARRRANQFIPLLTTIRGQWEGRSYVFFFADCFSMNGGPTF